MNNITRLRKYLDEQEMDGILIRRRNNFSWLTNGRSNHIVLSDPHGVADLFVFKDRVYLITPKMEERRIIEEECSYLPFEVIVRSAEWYEGTNEIIDSLAYEKRVASDSPYMKWDVVDEDLSKIRSVLTEEEVGRYRQLCLDAAESVEATCKEIFPGQSEFEIAALLNEKAISKGIVVHVALVATDERIYKYRHPIPTDKKLEKHAMIVICAERGGLIANATRFVYFGELPLELAENRERLAKIDAVMNDATRPGVKVGDIIQQGIQQYEEAGFPEDWKLLHQGGLTGFNTREYLATPDSNDTVKPNQAFAWNPALPGIKSEDTILVGENEVEILTHTNKWNYLDVEVNGKNYKRPDIFVRTF